VVVIEEKQAFSVGEFCLLHGMTRAMLLYLWRHNAGPKVMRVGTRTLISREEAKSWRGGDA
jgi:hypothetical protein